MYAIEFSKEAEHALRRMPRNVAALIRKKLDLLCANPHAANNNVTQLKGSADFRLRVGDWRVVYTIEDDRLVIVISASGREDQLMTKLQIIEQDGKPAFAVLPIDEWRRIERLLEDASDQAAIDRWRESGEETFPAAVVYALVDGQNPVRVHREHRGLTQRALADAVGIAVPYLSQIETGKRGPSTDILKKLAEALRVSVDDLI